MSKKLFKRLIKRASQPVPKEQDKQRQGVNYLELLQTVFVQAACIMISSIAGIISGAHGRWVSLFAVLPYMSWPQLEPVKRTTQ